jgi:hypothetical protein
LIHVANVVPLRSTRIVGTDRVHRTTIAVTSAATTSDETTIVQEELDDDSLVVLAGTRTASRTEGSPEELGIGST